jgi:hypothetical protein
VERAQCVWSSASLPAGLNVLVQFAFRVARLIDVYVGAIIVADIDEIFAGDRERALPIASRSERIAKNESAEPGAVSCRRWRRVP